MWKPLRWIGNTYSQGLWKTVKTMLHLDSSHRPRLDSLPLLSRLNTVTKGALDCSLTRHLSHSPLSTPQTTDRAPILVDSETTNDDVLKKDDVDEDRDFDRNEALQSVAEPVPTSPELILRNKPPSFSSEPAVDFFTPKTKASRCSQRRGCEGKAEERGRSGRKGEGSVWNEPDSFPTAQPLLPPISTSSPRLAPLHVLPRPSDVFGRQGRVANGMGGGRGRGEKEGWRRKEKGTRREERGRGNQQAMRCSEHKEQARNEEMEFPRSEDVNIVTVSSLLSSLSSLSLSMKTTKTAMTTELDEFSAFMREWEAEGQDLGNEADNTELEALMGVLQEEMRKTEELDYVVADAEYSKTHSLRLSRMGVVDSKISSSTDSPCPDCSALLNWNEAKQTSDRELAVIFRSLVATLKLQPALDVALEAKAVRLLKSIHQWTHPSINDFINVFGRTTDESSTNFVQSIVVLISSPSQAIIEAAMKMVGTLLTHCSRDIRLALAKADLIPQLIITLNPLSLSFTEAVDIHIYLLTTINKLVWLATPDGLVTLGIKGKNRQQAVHETPFQQILVPSEKYICHLCMNRFSIIDVYLSDTFLDILAALLEICPYYQPSMDFVLHMPVTLTIPSYLVFCELDFSIRSFLYEMVIAQLERIRQRDEVRQMWKTMHRMLRMEGVEDVIEAKQGNDKELYGGGIVDTSISWNNLLGMNLPRIL
ncbi:hypothetical protein BLNAU_21429 [Blattamonas nauphoetae]|uniref:Uncharacterized protein n=1 Tax=Blattamonas nauphoetae TaxID=2049346 RepID=A0ABQ9WVW1_9EUKA|nr:hypothetical protein BLNAU_21429 [Blattamonas nauphoetae]